MILNAFIAVLKFLILGVNYKLTFYWSFVDYYPNFRLAEKVRDHAIEKWLVKYPPD